MNKIGIFETGHEDLIHSIAYDEYGTRIVTCSSDQKLKIWDWVDSHWELNDSFRAHDGSILKASWAHPEFGQVFCTCSFDRTIRVFEEVQQETKKSSKRWIEKQRFSDSKATVLEVSFAPHHFGLKIASVDSYGMVRIYECLDPVNLGPWEMQEVDLGRESTEGHYSIDWCKALHLPQMFVVSKDNAARVYSLDKSNKWVQGELLSGHLDTVRSVAWAPQVGKSYQMIATGSKDGHVRIYKLSMKPGESRVNKPFQVEQVGDLTHAGQVWHVSWNITGTVLSSSGDDGQVKLWKSSYLDEWRMLSVISSERQER
ncbi:WD40-repeat-containing domain protein [Gorgonomyces haynaldii]|nr:WD40-repeat-containing domain protein [Gorgonomyces haynaldii]